MDYNLDTSCTSQVEVSQTSQTEMARTAGPELLAYELSQYQKWLQSQPWSPHTIRAYSVRAKQFVLFLRNSRERTMNTPDRSALIAGAKRFQDLLHADASISPSTTNALLAAVENFLKFIKLPELKLARKQINSQTPNSLDPDQERRYLEIVAKLASAKESAMIHLLLATGIRIAECASLTLSDFEYGPHGNWLCVNSAQSRRIPLEASTVAILQNWLRQREKDNNAGVSQALFPNRQGEPISTRGIDHIVRKLGYFARLQVSAEVLRQTCLLKLFKGGHDLQAVAAITGFKALRNAHRYCQPDSSSTLVAADSSL